MFLKRKVLWLKREASHKLKASLLSGRNIGEVSLQACRQFIIANNRDNPTLTKQYVTAFQIETRNVTVCNRCPRRFLVCDTPSHYALSFCDVSLNLLQYFLSYC